MKIFRSSLAWLVSSLTFLHALWLVLGALTAAEAQTVPAEKPLQTVDYIVALVNSEPITNSDLRAALRRVSEQMRLQGQTVPPTDVLRQTVLEHLINDRVQLQMARDYGIRLEDSAVDIAEQNLARQYQTNVDGLRQRLAADGLSTDALRSDLRNQLMIARLREREVDAKVVISDQELDRYIAQQALSGADPSALEVNLAQLLVAVPEKASASEVARLHTVAESLLERLRKGEKWLDLVKQYSAGDRSNGGQFGLRRADRYPPSFLAATRDVAVGGYAELVRSDAGFHILTVVERRPLTTVSRTIVQRHARHILLRTGAALGQEEALARLADYRKRIATGKDSFESLARTYSQDGSAERGGDLGWSVPGMFVPEFEEVMFRLKNDEISAPFVSRFGVHLIQLLESRVVELNSRDARELVRQELRQIKTASAYTDWSKDLRERAFVELREVP